MISAMKDIPGYEDKYAVTEDGRVWSYEKKVSLPNGAVRIRLARFLKPSYRGKKGKLYKVVELSYKAFSVHRLVAIVYIPNPHNYPQVNHKDGDKFNNHADNLEWCTQQQNSRHAQDNGLNVQKYGEDHGGHKLSTLAVMCMRMKRSKGTKLVDLAKEFNCSVSNVSYICKGETRIYG